MPELFSPLLFALSCNLDTVLLAAGYRLRGARLSPVGTLIIAAVTTVITVLSLALGGRVALLLAPEMPNALGGVVLVAMGLWFLLDWLRCPGEGEILPAAENSGCAWVTLAAALGVNNAGAGVAAGVSGVSPLVGGAVNFGITFLSLAFGHWLGSHAVQSRLGSYALPASGILLAVLGVVTLMR